MLSSLNPGGAENQTVLIIREAVRRGHEVTAILPNGAGHMDGNLLPRLQETGARIIDLVTHTDKGSAIQTALESIKPDVMYSVGYPLSLLATIAAYRTGVPVRIIRYESTGHDREQFRQSDELEELAHSCATYLVGNSQAVVDSLLQYPGADGSRARVVYNGVDYPMVDDALRAWARQDLKDPDTVVIGLLANFRADGLKNQGMLVRAMAHLRHQPAVAMLYGYPSDYQVEVEAEVDRLGLRDTVLFPGRLADLRQLAGWDIAANTSHTEGLSNAIMECMAYGLPIVATRVGGNPEIVEHGVNGFLVDDDDDLGMAQALEWLITDEHLRQTLGQVARADMLNRHNWDVIMGQWEALYHGETN